MPPIPDLVRVSKLDTQFCSSPEYTQHVQYVSGNTLQRRRVRKEERWKKEKGLGRGSFGIVWLERCIHGDCEGKVRAVKKVQKLDGSNYHRELEAIALFSHNKYEQCFVKSYGWYDDDDSIFITMEYLPNGDLHKYLGSPLSESEGQHIVSQVLEGLDFMHQNGFAHRDLKPANILVVSKRPNWWVKIADFGISKRATEELTALRTLTGTPAFAAPEVLGFIQSDSYTNAVDIWSLGVIAFLILTGQTLFRDQRRLGKYVAGTFAFPSDVLLANNISGQGSEFVRSLMAPNPEDRPRAKESLQNPWLGSLPELVVLESLRTTDISKPPETPLPYLSAEDSASWSTQDQTLRHILHSSRDDHTQEADPKLRSSLSTQDDTVAGNMDDPTDMSAKTLTTPSKPAIVESTLEARIQAYSELSTTLKGHSDRVEAVAFSPDGRLIASASWDRTVRLWDSATGTARATLEGHSDRVDAVAFSPDGRLIASASGDRTVRLWDSATGTARATLEGHSTWVGAVAFSPDGRLIASASWDRTVRLWDSATGTARATLEGHSTWVNAAAFSPDGRLIASASWDRTVRLWDSATGTARATLEGHSDRVDAVAFSPDGRLIASASWDRTVRLWDSATGTARATLEGHSDWVKAVAFSPDGRLIASASGDRTVRLWDSATGTARATLEGHSDWVDAVAFSPDGRLIASASGDKNVRLWGASLATVQKRDNTVLKYVKKVFK